MPTPRDDKTLQGAGQWERADEATGSLPASLQSVIDEIRHHHRTYVYAMEQRKRADLSLGAYLRMMLGWRRDLPEKERKAIAVRAQQLVALGEADAKGKPATADSDYTDHRPIIAASLRAREPFDGVEKTAVKNMERLAAGLPVWGAFGAGVRGFGLKSLAVIVAEAGDLSDYPTKGHLWKRMGLAVLDGVRQGGLAKGATNEAWIAHGYSPSRRSRVWNIGDAMLKAQIRKVKDDADEDTGERIALGPYGEAYLRRKAYEVAREPEIAPIKAHRRAQRYMEKRLLRDLWQAWRRAAQPLSERTVKDIPAANLSSNASDGRQRRADWSMPERAGKRVPAADSVDDRVALSLPARSIDLMPDRLPAT